MVEPLQYFILFCVLSRLCVCFGRQQFYDEFQLVLDRAVEVSVNSVLDGGAGAMASYIDDGSYGPLSLQQINVCTTLAAYNIYKVKSFESFPGVTTSVAVGSSGAVGGVGVVNAAEPEASLRAAEDLLKKAEFILSTTVAAASDAANAAAAAQQQASNQTGAVVSQQLPAGRGAQLAAAARLMLSTSAASPTAALRSGAGGGAGRGGAAPQQVAHTEMQKRFLDGLSHSQRQTLSPLICYGFLYLAQYSGKCIHSFFTG